jgi:hypothetical protein
LTITAVDGIPSKLNDASNSIKGQVTLRCSLRLPPTLKGKEATEILEKILNEDKPYQAEISF